MKIAVQSDPVVTQRQVLKYVDCYYTIDGDDPTIHIISRDEDRNQHHIEVEGFTPYFCVPQSERSLEEWQSLFQTDYRITDIDVDANQSMDGEQLVLIEVRNPRDIRDIRDKFDEPLEADVRYPQRFLIDTGIKQCFSVPS